MKAHLNQLRAACFQLLSPSQSCYVYIYTYTHTRKHVCRCVPLDFVGHPVSHTSQSPSSAKGRLWWHSLARCGDGSGCKGLDQSAGGGFPRASVGLELFRRENCLERDAKASIGSRCPKGQRGFRFPMASWHSVVRGNGPSDGGVERYVHVWRRANGGRSSLGSDRAVNYTDQTLNHVIPKTHPRLREASGGERCVGGADSPPAQAAAPVHGAGGQPRQGWSSSPRGDALQGPRGCSVELAHSFASPSPCVADGALFFQTLLSFFPFVWFFFECPTLLTYDSTGA